MRTTKHDQIYPHHPVDNLASRVIKKGSTFDYVPATDTRVLDAVPVSSRAIPQNPQFVDLTGVKFGRLTVLSYAGASRSKGALWNVRCVCGAYEQRRAKFLKTGIADDALCSECHRHRENRKMYAERKDLLAKRTTRRCL